METNIDQVFRAIDSIYSGRGYDANERNKAPDAAVFLDQLQRSVEAWKVGDQLLHMKRDLNSCFFAALTLRIKIQYSFAELPEKSHESFRASMINHVSHLNKDTYQGIATQLCVGLADLALLLDKWTDPIGDLIKQFGPGSPEPNIFPLLEVLIAMPEEAKFSRNIKLGHLRRDHLDEYFRSQVPVVIQLLHIIVIQNKDENTHIKTLRCLSSWFSVTSKDWTLALNTCLIKDVIHIVRNPQKSPRLHEIGTDCVCSALLMIQREEASPLAAVLFAEILQMESEFQTAVCAEDLSAVTNYARMLTELGEALLNVLVQKGPNYPEGQQVLHLILICVGHHEWEVAEITFNFWYKLSEVIYCTNNDNLSVPFVPYIMRLIEALYRHCQIDADQDGILMEQDDFYEFRERVQDLIKDVAFICGAKTIFGQMSNILHVTPNIQWNNMESAVFIMQSIAKSLLTNEDHLIPPVIDGVLNQPDDVHIQVAYTSLLLISELGDWMYCHPELLPRVLTFLTKRLQQPNLSTISARAMDSVCQSCRDHMVEHFDGLMGVATSIDSFGVSNEAVVGLLKGIATILGRLPSDKIGIYLKNLCDVQVIHLQQLLIREGKSVSGNNSATDPVVWLDRLAAIFRSVNPIIANGQVNPCQEVIMEIWPTLAATFRQYSSEIRIMEHSCRCVRFAVRCVHQQSASLLPELVDLIVTQYATTGFSCFVYLGSILVDEYASLQGCLDGLLRMLQAFMEPTFTLLCKPNGFKNHPDTVDDWFRLCTRFLQRAPIPFLQCSVITNIIECGLQACMLDHKDANSSVVRFFGDLLGAGMKQDDSPDYRTRRDLVQNIMNKHGQILVNNLITAAIFILPCSLLREVTETVYQLILFDRAQFCLLLENKLKELPKKNVSGMATVDQSHLVEAHKNITKATKPKEIYKALDELTRYYT